MTCEQVRESAAVALLTRSALDADVTEHLAGCELCRAELGRLAPLPDLLGLLDATDLETVPQADPALLDRLLAAASRERRHNRSRILAVAAAAVVVLVVPLGFVVSDSLSDTATQVVAQQTVADWHAADAANGVSGRAQVWTAKWGSALTVSVAGVPAGTRCTIVVVTKDGQRQTAATWVASYTGIANVKGTVAAPWKSIARVDIVDDTGKVLLHIADA